MNIQEEREAFESWFRTTATYKTLWDFISIHQTNIKSVFVKKNGKTYQNDCVQIAWEAWQAAKAKAVPEGFVLVPNESLKVALFWMNEDIDPWQMGGDSFADLFEHKPILEKVLIEAQEQKG